MKTMMMKMVALPSISKGVTNLKVTSHFSPSGETDKPVYKYVYDEKYGCPRRVLTGKMDLQAFIQESRDNVDFASLGKMLVDTKANIIDHFVDKDGQVIDITGLPRNVHEASKMMVDLQEHFASLPGELKMLFDNDFDIFRASYKAGTLGQKIDQYYQSVTKAVEETTEKGE